MTVDELLELVGSRGWSSRLHVQGVSTAGLTDNVYVLGTDGDAWFLGFHERGTTEVMARYPDESSAVSAVLALLDSDHRPAAADSPAGRMAADPARATGRWSTWTFAKRD